ncbi:MAG: hypothetical protein LLG00_12005 [Planctomycetaceae bacterium]|nr:hypothetical protein [Planctomycetaceae bacterium]
MDANEAENRMREIQRIMERATLFTLLPGTAAVVGGLLVLVGCAVSYAMFRSLDFADILHLPVHGQIDFCVMWFLIGVAGVLVEVILTNRAAAGQQLTSTSRPMRVAAFSLTPSVIVAMVLTVKFLVPVDARVWSMLWSWNFNVPLEPRAEEIQYIVPVWMMLYGTGVYTAGLFSIRPPRVLGLMFLAMGVIALLCFPQYGVVSAALSFGVLHLVFGLYILHKQRQTVL